MPDDRPLPLAGVHVVELSSFVAVPSAGLVLSQLGADVVRVDPVGGAPDTRRWPLAEDGRSLYWAGLNRGKHSVVLDLTSDEGRSTFQELVCAPGDDRGVLLTNVGGKAWSSDETLRARRADLIHVQVLGRSDGGPAVDYTVNAASGVPFTTGPAEQGTPVNHAIPPWDLLCGMQAAVAVLAALHRRTTTGAGTYATVALEDVAMATLTTLGYLPEAQLTGTSRPASGNFVYGTFGVDLALADGGRVMVVALTARQWEALLEVTGTLEVVTAVERALGADFADEGQRWVHREVLTAILRPWFAARTTDAVARALHGTHVLWGPYRHFTDVVTDVVNGSSPVVRPHAEAGFGEMLATTGAIRLRGEPAPAMRDAPVLGADTDVLVGADRAKGA